MRFPGMTHSDIGDRLSRARALAVAGIIGPAFFSAMVIIQGWLP